MNAETPAPGFDGNIALVQASIANKAAGGGAAGGDPVANSKDMLENLLDNIGDGKANVATIVTGIPHLSGLLNTGIFKGVEMLEGGYEKLINSYAASFSTPGGFLYRMLSPLLKDGSIKDLAEGVGGEMLAGEGSYGDSGGGGDAGGGFSGDSGFIDAGGGAPIAGADIEPLIVEYGGRQYSVSESSEGLLGSLTPSAGADAGGISKGDIELG